MATLESKIKIKMDLRPCLVNQNHGKTIAPAKAALFHKFVEESRVIDPSPMIGGHNGGVIRYTLAIVEYDDGTVAMVEPTRIKFVDNKIKEYAF